MSMTVLELIQTSCYETNAQIVPSTLVGATDASTLQLKALFLATGRELRQARWWPQLKRSYSVNMESQRSAYPLPQDFYSAIPNTFWDQGNKWRMQGPMTDGTYDYRLYGYVTIENRIAFRIFGPDINPNDGRGQFMINPIPGTAQQNVPLTFEYISKTWLYPPNWTASTSYAANSYVNSSGNIYKKGSTTQTSGTYPPNMAYGQGQDGGVFWTAFSKSNWAGSTVYAPGAYVTNGGNLYVCITGGTSASSGGPSGTDTDTNVTDGTVTWLYKAVDSWTAQTSYTTGDVILISSQYYICTTPGTQGNNTQVTGSTQPAWTATTASDGTITNWDFWEPAYETIVSDNDLCLFDDELMIAGLKWRFMRARGLQYEDLLAEYTLMKDTAVGRYQPGMILSLGGGGVGLAGLNPNVPEGSFGNIT